MLEAFLSPRMHVQKCDIDPVATPFVELQFCDGNAESNRGVVQDKVRCNPSCAGTCLLLSCSASIIEALPDRPDPAMWGGMQPVAPGALAVQGIK